MVTLQKQLQIKIGKITISKIKECVGEISGTHVNLNINSRCVGCGASMELLALIREMDIESNVT